MLRNLLVGLGLILGLTLGAPVVEAAPITLTVVTACGTPPTTYTVGQAFPGTQDTTGKLCDTGSGGGGGGGTSSTFGAAFPATGTAAGFSDGTNMQGARVFDGDTGGGFEYDVGTILRVPASGGSAAAAFGNGTAGTTSLRVTVASDSTGVLGVTQSTSPWVVTGAGGSFPITGATSNASSAVATSATNVPTVGYNYQFNGTTWDQSHSGDVNNATGVIGFADSVPTARYNATLPTLTDTRYNSLQVGQRGSLHMELWGSDSTTAIGNFTAGADGSTNTKSGLFVYNYPFLYNGTTWDRAPGTAAGGGFVQGNVASGVADSGNPVKTGSVFTTTVPTVTDGQRASFLINNHGGLVTGQATTGADATGNTQANMPSVSSGGSALQNLPLATFPYVFNGSTWDRTPGTTTGVYAINRDAAGNARGANVTAASTSAALTDTALVVSLSPNPDNVCTGKTPINQTTSTDVKTFTNVGYICSIILVSATAQNISVIEGTGTVCATGTTAVIGGTSASMAVGVNGGFSAVSDRPWVQLGASADHLCILQSASGNVSGIITWVDHS